MKKNGFTLVELLVVIAIIAILSVIIVPSVIKVNQTINERMYKQKKDNIVSAAELYASDNPDIFNGAESVYIYVYQLIDANYIVLETVLLKEVMVLKLMRFLTDVLLIQVIKILL